MRFHWVLAVLVGVAILHITSGAVRSRKNACPKRSIQVGCGCISIQKLRIQASQTLRRISSYERYVRRLYYSVRRAFRGYLRLRRRIRMKSPRYIRRRISWTNKRLQTAEWYLGMSQRDVRKCLRAHQWFNRVNKVLWYSRRRVRRIPRSVRAWRRIVTKLSKSPLKNTQQCQLRISFDKGKIARDQAIVSNHRKVKIMVIQARRDKKWACTHYRSYVRRLNSRRNYVKMLKRWLHSYKANNWAFRLKNYYTVRVRIVGLKAMWRTRRKDYMRRFMHLQKMRRAICQYLPHYFIRHKSYCRIVSNRWKYLKKRDSQMRSGRFEFETFFKFMRKNRKEMPGCPRKTCAKIVVRRSRRRLRHYRGQRRFIRMHIKSLTWRLDRVNKAALKYAATYRTYIEAKKALAKKKSRSNQRRVRQLHLRLFYKWSRYSNYRAMYGGSPGRITRAIGRQKKRLRRLARMAFAEKRIIKSRGRLVCVGLKK